LTTPSRRADVPAAAPSPAAPEALLALDETLVRRSLQAAGLAVPDDQLADVVANLRRMAALAALLATQPTDPHDAPGPTWVP
jgi:hypothetical protein